MKKEQIQAIEKLMEIQKNLILANSAVEEQLALLQSAKKPNPS